MDNRERLKRAIAWESIPTLDEDDIDDLISLARIADAEGNLPSDAGWEESFDLNLAAYEGWGRKAAKAASMIAFSADDASFRRDQYIQHCQQMQAQFAARVAYTVNTSSRIGRRRHADCP